MSIITLQEGLRKITAVTTTTARTTTAAAAATTTTIKTELFVFREKCSKRST